MPTFGPEQGNPPIGHTWLAKRMTVGKCDHGVLGLAVLQQHQARRSEIPGSASTHCRRRAGQIKRLFPIQRLIAFRRAFPFSRSFWTLGLVSVEAIFLAPAAPRRAVRQVTNGLALRGKAFADQSVPGCRLRILASFRLVDHF